MALNRLNELYEEYAEPEADFDALAKEQADLEDIIQALDAHNLEHRLEVAADALRLPPWDSEVNSLSGGRASQSSSLSATSIFSRYASPGRTYKPLGRGEYFLVRTIFRRIPRDRGRYYT